MLSHTDESKRCPICHRPFYNRKKWQSRGQWAAIKYCSQRCRNNAKKLSKPV